MYKIKAASIIPYHWTGERYLYLLGFEKKHQSLCCFGGKVETSDNGNPWTTACREFGEEFWGLSADRLEDFIQKMADHPPQKDGFLLRNLKCYYFFCPLEPILHHLDMELSPDNVLERFQPNDEMSQLYWIRGEDLWTEIKPALGKQIFGKNAFQVFMPLYPIKNIKILLREGFLQMSLQVLETQLYTAWETKKTMIRQPGYKATEQTK